MPLPLFVPEGSYQLLSAALTRRSFSPAAPALRWLNSESALPGFVPPAAQQPWGTTWQRLRKGRVPPGGGRGREGREKKGRLPEVPLLPTASGRRQVQAKAAGPRDGAGSGDRQ